TSFTATASTRCGVGFKSWAILPGQRRRVVMRRKVLSHPRRRARDRRYGVRELAPAFGKGACSRRPPPGVAADGSKLPDPKREQAPALHIGGCSPAAHIHTP